MVISVLSPPLGSAVGYSTELDSGWELLPDPSGQLSSREVPHHACWRPARPAVCWNAQYDDLRGYMGVMWYRTQFLAESAPQVLLHFGAVDYYCDVYINGELAGSHEGGYTPFSFDIARHLHPGINQLLVRVIDPPMDEQANLALCPGMMYNEIPHGKQNWYVQNGGIWQRVWVEHHGALRIAQFLMTPAVDGAFTAHIQLAGCAQTQHAGPGMRADLLAATALELVVRDPDGVIASRQSLEGLSSDSLTLQGRVEAPRLWSPESPALYTAEVFLTGPAGAANQLRFGFRSFQAREGRLYLNGKPFYLRGALDQDFYPETIHSPSSPALVREMMLQAKRLGINVLRCHLKVCDPLYLDTADELGLMVWAEMPSWSDCWYPADHFSTKAAERGRRMFDEVLVRDWNHPCLVIQTLMNESWGIDLKSAAQRRWLVERFKAVKRQLAPLGRLVIDNSACEKNFHLVTDLEDFHNYYSMPDDAAKWERWTRELAGRAAWTFSPHGDAERTHQEPLIVSEFGNWGLPRLAGELPWWLNCDFGGRELTRPTGVLERFHQFGFNTLYPDFAALAEDTQMHQFLSVKHQIEDMRQHPSIQGYVVTGMTDVHWEANGLLEMDRTPKVYGPELSLLQRDDLILLRPAKRNYVAGETVEAEVLLSHYSTTGLAHSTVRWSAACGLHGRIEIPQCPEPGTVTRAGHIRFPVPEVSENQRVSIYIELCSAGGEVIAVNSIDLFFFVPALPIRAPLVLHDPTGLAGTLASALPTLASGESIAPGAVMLATRLDDTAEQHLAQGGPLLLLCYSEDALPANQPLRVRSRHGCELDGRWFSNFNWIRPESGPYAAINFGIITGFEAAEVTPRCVIQGLDPASFASIFAGATYGWLGENSALALPLDLAGYPAVATTFCFDHYGRDPYSTHLLHGLVEAAIRAVRPAGARTRPLGAAADPLPQSRPAIKV